MAENTGPVQTGLTVLLAGASGLIGRALSHHLVQSGHTVHRLVRRAPIDASEHQWNPEAKHIQSGIVAHVDVVVNLSGASISRMPWSRHYQSVIMNSRLAATETLADAIQRAESPPKAFISASAVGFYGDRGDEELTEESARGTGFLADVCVAWEAAASRAARDTTRVCFARTGLVLADGGALTPLKLQTLLGVGGLVGPGTQWWPWISLTDEVRALTYLIENPLTTGPYNLVGPEPAPASEVTRELARLLRRPHRLGLPSWAIRTLLGQAGEELLLPSQKILPRRLLQQGFSFEHKTVGAALESVLGRRA